MISKKIVVFFVLGTIILSHNTIIQGQPFEEYLFKKTPTRDLSLNVYYPEGEKPSAPLPAIVFFFGGGWVGGNPGHFDLQCKYLASRGMIAIAADYRIKSKDKTTPIESIMDAKSAMRWVYKNADMLGVDTEKLAAAGGSAGGHLAASTATIKMFDDPGDDQSISPVPKLLVLFNPVIDCSEKGYGANKLGADTINASPVHHVVKGLPPTMIFHGDVDVTVPHENVTRFTNKMKEIGNECELVTFYGKGHGFFNAERDDNINLKETVYLMDKFLAKHGYISGEPTIFTGGKAEIYCQPLMSGEPTHNSIILQARLVESPYQQNKDVIGKPGIGYFEISENAEFTNSIKTDIKAAKAENDFIIKNFIENLKPSTNYFFRLNFGMSDDKLKTSETASFRTLPGKEKSDSVSFVMVTGSHYERFFWNWGSQNKDAMEKPSDEVLSLGFPGHRKVWDIAPHFYIGNGDNVYYDHEKPVRAESVPEMQASWHKQFSLPRYQQLLLKTPVYWMKDDHDYRFDDADTTAHPKFGDTPTHPDGVKTFIEQLPFLNPEAPNAKPYRTYRVNNDLQIWMLEGRDYRSPNSLPDDENKSIWGKEQLSWLKKTLIESDAAFKLLITPTPMIGPDDKRKTDNHCNFNGFRTERDAFFKWIVENDFLNKGFYILCGDRHWQYHSVHPTGIEEFSCGALVDKNSRLGVNPGSPNSTDPEGKIKQIYTQTIASGGFLNVIMNRNAQNVPTLTFNFYDETGKIIYNINKKLVEDETNLFDPTEITGKSKFWFTVNN